MVWSLFALGLVMQGGALPADSTYATPALATFVEHAARINRQVPAALAGYTSTIESELALLVNAPAAAEGAIAGTAAASTEAFAQVEQVQLEARWDRRGTFTQRLIGYRARQLAPMVSALNMVPRPWTAPALYGDRLALVFGGAPAFRRPTRPYGGSPAVHPLAADRAVYYRFTGGDTVVTLRLGTRSVPLVQVNVEPRSDAPEALLLAGFVLVDASTGQLVRLRGRIQLVAPPDQSTTGRLLRRLGGVREVAYLDYENSEYDGRFWLPSTQRLEYQVLTGVTEGRATIRVQSRWRDVRLAVREAADSVAAEPLREPAYSLDLSAAAGDWNGWRTELGALTAAVSARDFDDVAPPAFRPDGPSQWRWQARGLGDLLRVNRVEGVYAGLAGRLDLRDARPGLTVRVLGGWSFVPAEPTGAIEAAYVRGPWVPSVRAERAPAATNDFGALLGRPGGNPVASLLGVEDVDWVDRRLVAAGVSRELGSAHTAAVRAEVALQRDAAYGEERTRGLLGGVFRRNRPVDAGTAVRSRVQLEAGRNVFTSPLAAGVGSVVSYERGDGDLAWQRAQAQVFAQRILHRVIVAARGDVAVVAGARVPVQQLLELGGAEGLPGYGYKAFAGDRAVAVRGALAYQLPLLEDPVRVRGLVVPALAPQVQVALFAGRTDATSRTRERLEALTWATSDGWRGSLDLRLRFLAGALSVGASRPLERRGAWRATIGLGGTL